jgi:hypothetical protein
MGLVGLREEVRWLRENYQASQQRVCGLMQIAVSSFRYRTTQRDAALRERLVELAWKKPQYRVSAIADSAGRQRGARESQAGIFAYTGKQDSRYDEKRERGWCARVRHVWR